MSAPEWNGDALISVLNEVSDGKLDLEYDCAILLRMYAVRVGREEFVRKVNVILDALIKIRDNGTMRIGSEGICTTILPHIGAVGLASPEMNILYCAYPSWDGWSGSFVFPVTDPIIGTNHCHAYSMAIRYRSMWEGAYGQQRLELLDFLIHWCTQLDVALRKMVRA